jgi:hypothetical protein
MATTPNFSWPTPDNTDLVKNGALAIRTLGDAIDASLVDLEGGTTDQVLAKNSNTDMDFKWVTSDDANAIQNAIVDAKGDLIAASANDTPARLAVGANDLLLTAASGEATGLKYTGGWTSYTPSFTNLTVGNGTLVGRYQQIGKIVNVYVALRLGSTSSVGSSPYFDLPIAQGRNTQNYIYTGAILDAGTADILGCVVLQSGGAAYICFVNTASTSGSISYASATTPMTWTTNDVFQFLFSYEVA